MRILYHHRTRSTDAQRIHILEMVRAFEALGHEVEMASLVPTDAGLDDAKRDAGDAGWKKLVRRIPFSYDLVQLGYNLIGIPMLLATCVRKRVDFIYERYSLFNFAGVVVGKLCGIPVVLEVNSPFALEQQRDREIRLVGFASWSERRICNLASHVIVVSTPLRRILEGAGVQPEKIRVMSNGVCLERFQSQPGSQELRQRLGLDGCTVIGFVGWFRKWHGLELLLEAFHHNGLASERAKVLMIGDGPAMVGLQEYVLANGLSGSVVFTGPLPHAQVPPYLDAIDIAVQPAANEYCCPMKILEYMALGKPIVAPRQENIQDLLRDGEEAQYFTPGDAASLSGALKALVTDPARSRRMGERVKRAITERGFLWEENAARVVRMVKPERPAGSR
jgi:glycosyltransferase involved in cell wall biosynthesis